MTALRKVAWPAAVVLAVLVCFSPALSGGRTLARRDSARQMGPCRVLVAEALRDGRLPLWNPYEGTGMPLFADGVHSVLHPVSIAGALIAPRSVDFLIVGYLLFAALGAWAFSRAMGASEAAAAAAGVAYATCGFVVSMTGNTVFLAGAGSLAWLLAAARWAGGGRPWGSVACAVSAAVAFFSGDVQMTIVGVLAGSALAWDAGGPRAVLRVVSGLAVGALLAGVQICATWSLLPQTMRGYGIPEPERLQWALHPLRLFEWAIPGLGRGPLSGVLTTDLLGGPVYPGPFAESVYLGTPLLLLGASGIHGARARTRALLLGIAGLLLWAALGHRLGARQLLDTIPVWSSFRFSEKLMAPLSLLACAGAAMGIDRLRSGRLARPIVGAAAVLGVGSGVALTCVLLGPGVARTFLSWGTAEGAEFLLGTLRVGLWHAAIGCGALLLIDRGPLRARAAAAGLLVAVSTAAAIPFGARFGDALAQSLPVEIPLDAAPPGPRLAHPVDPELSPRPVGGLDPTDTLILSERRQGWPSWNVGRRLDAVSAYTGLQPLRLNALQTTFRGSWWVAVRRYAVTHVVAGWRSRPEDFEATALAVQGGRHVYREEAPLLEIWSVPHAPWTSFVERARVVRQPGEALREVTAGILPDDFGTVVLEAPEELATGPGRVLSVSRGVEEVRVDAEAASAALLVVRDAFWPGWRAWVDGQEVPILAADVLVRAVPVPPGRHVLRMHYEPEEVRYGLWVSALGGLAMAALALEAWRRGHRASVATKERR